MGQWGDRAMGPWATGARRVKVAAAVGWLVFTPLSAGCTATAIDRSSPEETASPTESMDPRFRFALQGVSVTADRDPDRSSSFSARSIVYRNRVGGAGFSTLR